MASSLARRVVECILSPQTKDDHLILRIVLLRTAKAAFGQAIHRDMGRSIINVNRELAERVLEIMVKQRALLAAALRKKMVQLFTPRALIPVHSELACRPHLQKDPFRLLPNLARHRSLVAAWTGGCSDSTLTHGEPGVFNYRRFIRPDAAMVSTSLLRVFRNMVMMRGAHEVR